ncbi:MAG: neutral/alkaline non-lysosomal ceramidase N-terminal domain-containing protein [Thermoanaerobaculales bacterium]
MHSRHLHAGTERERPPARPGAYPFALLILASVLSVGCQSVSGMTPVSRRAEPTGVFLAGASRVDITPMPGFAMGGHSAAGAVARGRWMRLYARAIYLEDADGSPVTLVSCDLWSVPAGLVDRIAEVLAETYPKTTVGRDQILLAATHTHHSPGSFSTSVMYNLFASSKPGFDPRLFEFLAQRVAGAIAEAASVKRPARLVLENSEVPLLVRNRSFEPFEENPESASILASNHHLPLGPVLPEYPSPEAYRAVDARLRKLRVTAFAAPHNTIAIAGFLALHPTVLLPDTPLYGGDLIGAAAILSEEALSAGRDREERPVVAIFNGAEGDISAAWQTRDRPDVLGLARRLVGAILAPPEGEIPVSGRIHTARELVEMSETCFDEMGRISCTARRPYPGMAVLGGAEDGRTSFWDLGWKEGVRNGNIPGQGAKSPALRRPLTKLLFPRSWVPRTVPVIAVTIGDLLFAGLPGEFTMVMGQRIERALVDAGRADDVLLVGLANGYLSYFATPEEYDLQHYEGASTLYGPASGPLIAHALDQLVAGLQFGTAPMRFERYHYRVGFRNRQGLTDLDRDAAPLEGLEHLLRDPNTGEMMDEPPSFSWIDRLPDFRSGSEVTPRVWIESSAGDGTWSPLVVDGLPVDDDTLQFLTVAAPEGHGRARWWTYWLGAPATEKKLRFRLCARRLVGSTVCSEAIGAEL